MDLKLIESRRVESTFEWRICNSEQ